MTKNDSLPYSKILVIDTAERDKTSLSLVSAGKTETFTENVRAQELPKLLEVLLEKNRLLPKNIEALALVKREGSMTAIRIGTAVVNTFAWLNKVPIIEIEATNIEDALKNISKGTLVKTSTPLA